MDDDLRALSSEAAERGLVVRVAYNLRFLPVFREVERILRENVIGRTLFVRIEAGQHLAAWRPARPYALGYSASTARGGGVALDLSHELDYMRMLFGQPTAATVRQARSGSLGIESPDMFDAIYELPGGAVCSVHLDYLEPALRRRMRVVGTDGVIVCDIAARRLLDRGCRRLADVRRRGPVRHGPDVRGGDRLVPVRGARRATGRALSSDAR